MRVLSRDYVPTGEVWAASFLAQTYPPSVALDALAQIKKNTIQSHSSGSKLQLSKLQIQRWHAMLAFAREYTFSGTANRIEVDSSAEQSEPTDPTN